MNVLIQATLDGLLHPEPEPIYLTKLASRLELQLPEPTNSVENELYQRAHIEFQPEGAWASRRENLERLDGPLTGTWCEVVPAGAGLVAFLPNDDRPAPEVALFSRLGAMPGRLRFTLADGLGSPITAAAFEATLHCADVKCAGDNDCSGCCGACRCRARLIEGTTITITRCGCSVHFAG